jgi:hypothetical protein
MRDCAASDIVTVHCLILAQGRLCRVVRNTSAVNTMMSGCLTADLSALSPAARFTLTTLQPCGTCYHNSGGGVHARRLMAPNAESMLVPVRMCGILTD